MRAAFHAPMSTLRPPLGLSLVPMIAPLSPQIAQVTLRGWRRRQRPACEVSCRHARLNLTRCGVASRAAPHAAVQTGPTAAWRRSRRSGSQPAAAAAGPCRASSPALCEGVIAASPSSSAGLLVEFAATSSCGKITEQPAAGADCQPCARVLPALPGARGQQRAPPPGSTKPRMPPSAARPLMGLATPATSAKRDADNDSARRLSPSALAHSPPPARARPRRPSGTVPRRIRGFIPVIGTPAHPVPPLDLPPTALNRYASDPKLYWLTLRRPPFAQDVTRSIWDGAIRAQEVNTSTLSHPLRTPHLMGLFSGHQSLPSTLLFKPRP